MATYVIVAKSGLALATTACHIFIKMTESAVEFSVSDLPCIVIDSADSLTAIKSLGPFLPSSSSPYFPRFTLQIFNSFVSSDPSPLFEVCFSFPRNKRPEKTWSCVG